MPFFWNNVCTCVDYKTGDIVFQGDAIALAGHSGGQDKNSLYFELSHKGKAQDPITWLESRRY